MKIELKRTEEKYIEFKMIFTPENVEDTLKLKELEGLRQNSKIDGFYDDKWKETKFSIILY